MLIYKTTWRSNINIFYVHEDPQIAAQSLCDKHVVKMILESAQMLSTAHRLLDGKVETYTDIKPKFKNINGVKVGVGWIKKEKARYVLQDRAKEQVIYKVAHKNHPSSIWVRQSYSHYHWLYAHFVALCKEYTRRYDKIHATQTKLEQHLGFYPFYMTKLPNKHDDLIPPPCCMPDDCKITNDTVINYRYYYLKEKKDMLKYTNREIPHWVQEGIDVI